MKCLVRSAVKKNVLLNSQGKMDFSVILTLFKGGKLSEKTLPQGKFHDVNRCLSVYASVLLLLTKSEPYNGTIWIIFSH